MHQVKANMLFCSLTPGAKSKVKSSTQRAIRTKLTEQFPSLNSIIDTLIPKKEQLDSIKLYAFQIIFPCNFEPRANQNNAFVIIMFRPDRVTLYALNNHPLFFQHMDDPLIPHLAVVHRYPWAFRKIRIDRGAIRFVLSGATLMVPGLTSKGGRLPNSNASTESNNNYGTEDISAGEVVVVEAEGKKTACMVGQLRMGTEDMKKVKKGVAIEGGHYLGDGLWKLSF